MAAYADYTYYTDEYLGSAIASGDFDALALQASAVIDQLTFDRAAPIITADTPAATVTKIKNAVCAVAEQLQTNAASGTDGIASESEGNYSVTYTTDSAHQQTAYKKLYDAAGLWLGNTGLMFSGFMTGEYST